MLKNKNNLEAEQTMTVFAEMLKTESHQKI